MAKKQNFFISLISEKNEDGEYANMSIGRVAFWITFGLAVYKWTMTSSDITAAHTQMLYITATYNILKKSVLFQPQNTNKEK